MKVQIYVCDFYGYLRFILLNQVLHFTSLLFGGDIGELVLTGIPPATPAMMPNSNDR